MTKRTASQAVAAAVARGAIGQDRAKFWLAAIADGRAAPETVDMLWGPGHPVEAAAAPSAGQGDAFPEYPEYAAMWPSEAEAAARVDAAAAGHRAEVEALSDGELFELLFGPSGV